jgi:hypothetical protein
MDAAMVRSSRKKAMPEFLQTKPFGSKSHVRRELLTSVCALAAASLWPISVRAEDIQKGWASCAKCRTIFFDDKNKGHCAAGGAHTSGSTRVQLSFNLAEGPRLQGNWRFCNKCNALFFDGDPNKGVCPGGGGHRAQGLNFVLMHNIAGGGDQFRFCAKCHAMFEAGQGRCPAGENHAAAGFLFMLNPENSQPIDPG